MSIIKEEYKDDLVKTRKLLNENDCIELYQAFIVEPGAVIERNVDSCEYFLNVLGAVLDIARRRHVELIQDVKDGDKSLVLVKTEIPELNSRKEPQFPTEIVVTHHPAIEMLDSESINVSTEFLDIKSTEIIGVRIRKFVVKDFNEGTGIATNFELEYELVSPNDDVICIWSNEDK